MADAKWTPGLLLETSGAYWMGGTLQAGVKLGVFSILGDDALAACDFSERFGWSPRGVPMLLDALAAMGLLVKTGNRYANTPEARRLLCKDSPAYLGHILLHHHNLVESWAHLDEAVLTGRPVRERSSHLPDEGARESFLMGMFNLASLMAPRLVPEVDLEGRRRLLDLGGGPGTYAIHFCLANPRLEAVVFDLPTSEPFALKTIAGFGLEGRVTFQQGDFIEDRAAGRFDAAWLSHVLHGEGPENCEKMLRNATSVLVPGGLLLIHEFVLDDSMDAPLKPALFSLNMLVGTDEGRAYSEGQLRLLMEEAGAGDIRRLPFRSPNDSSILAGTV
jgi:SAM-dependent methyltransferase